MNERTLGTRIFDQSIVVAYCQEASEGNHFRLPPQSDRAGQAPLWPDADTLRSSLSVHILPEDRPAEIPFYYLPSECSLTAFSRY